MNTVTMLHSWRTSNPAYKNSKFRATKTLSFLLKLIVLFVSLNSASLFAQWSSNTSVNTPVIVATNTQTLSVVVPDETGGVIVAAVDSRSGTPDIYVQRLDGDGDAMWAANGIAVTNNATSELNLAAVTDGNGGIVLVWEDLRTDRDIYAQRIDANGNILWTTGGESICTFTNNQTQPTVTKTNDGFIFAWTDQRLGGANPREKGIYVQKVDTSGVDQWTADGVLLIDLAQDQYLPKAVHDGSNGAIVFMIDESNSWPHRVTSRQVSSTGVPQGAASGVQMTSATGFTQYLTDVVSDGAGGAFVLWQDNRSVSNQLYAQKVNSSNAIQWGSSGKAVTTYAGGLNPTIVPDGFGGAFVSFSVSGSYAYVQRLNSSGDSQFSSGLQVSNFTSPNLVRSAATANNRVITTYGGDAGSDVFAQIVDTAGNISLTSGGLVISNATSAQSNPQVVHDGLNGGVFVWNDFRSGNWDIYAQQMSFDGSLGTGSSTAPLTIPSLLTPADGATAQSLTPTLVWNSVTGASGYFVQVSTNGTFTALIVDSLVSGDTTYTFASALNNYTVYYWRVAATSASDTSAYSGDFDFRTLLGTPTLGTPANGSIFASRTPTLNWYATNGATSYALEVATDTGFTSIVYSTPSTVDTFYTFGSALDYYTVYYWRVRATDGSETTAFSSRYSFRTLITTPVLSLPADGAIVVPVLTNFKWFDVVGATTYQIQVATDIGFTNIVVSAPGQSDTSYTVGTQLESYTDYFWRVRAFDGSNATVYSSIWTFETEIASPTLVSPGNFEPGISIHPLLVWRVVNGATHYRFQFSASPSFATTMYDSVLTDTTFYVDSILANNTLYYWRVLAMNANDTSNYSSRTLRTVMEVIPYLTHPIDSALVYTLDPTVFWNINVSGTGISYDVLYTTDSTFLTGITILDAGTAITDTLYGLTPATRYFWRVRSKNSTAIITYSGIEAFYTYGEVNTVPTGSYPVGGETVYTYSPTLYWYLGLSSFPYSFDVRYKLTSSGTWTGPVNVGSSLSYSLSGLTPGASYDWQVRSINSADTSDWSATYTFSTYSTGSGSAPTPIISYPTDGVTVYTLVPELYWYTMTSTIGFTFDVEVRTDTLFTGTPNYTGISNLFVQTSALLPGTNYYFKVRTFNGSLYSSWSDWESFVTYGVTGTLVPELSHPVDSMVIYSNSTTLYWYVTGSYDTLTYEIQVSEGDTIFSGSYTTSNQNYPISGLTAGSTYYWRVRSFNGTNYSAYSAIESFVVTGNAGSLVPLLTWPVGGALQTTTVDFYWYVNGFAPTMTYQLQYASESDFSNAVTVSSGSTTTQVTGLVPGVLYYWRVRTYNGSTYSAYSATETFATVAGSAPVRPMGGSPVANVMVPTNAPTLSWFLPATGSTTEYEVQYATDAAFTNVTTISGVQVTNKSVSGLQPNTQYFWRVRSKNASGVFSAYSQTEKFVSGVTTSTNNEVALPGSFALFQNYPNPFNPATLITFALPVNSPITLKLYDILGREIAVLASGAFVAGVHTLQFSAQEYQLASGVYIYQLQAGEFRMTKKMLLNK